jgi:hypothetical protein
VGDVRTLPEKRKEKEIIRPLEPDATKKKRKEKEKDKKMESCQTTPGNSDNSLQLMCLKGMQTSFASPCLLRHLGGSPEHKRLEPPRLSKHQKIAQFSFSAECSVLAARYQTSRKNMFPRLYTILVFCISHRAGTVRAQALHPGSLSASISTSHS